MMSALKSRMAHPTRWVSVVAVMTAACVSTNYMLIGVANVKFMDLIVFVSGMVFGPFVGASVGVLTWLVYGTLNPYGFSLPVLVSTCTGESLYGVIGGLLGNRTGRNSFERADGSQWFINSKFAVAGFLLTFVYDLFTNIVSGFVAGISMTVALISGIPFSLAHEISNTAFFFFGAFPLVTAIGRLFQGGSC
jgi:LytS/YehU family sensor histidine kinase